MNQKELLLIEIDIDKLQITNLVNLYYDGKVINELVYLAFVFIVII